MYGRVSGPRESVKSWKRVGACGKVLSWAPQVLSSSPWLLLPAPDSWCLLPLEGGEQVMQSRMVAQGKFLWGEL